MILDANGTYLEIASSQEHLLFLPREELLGKSVREIFPKELAEKFIYMIQRTLVENRDKRFEYALKIQNNEVWFQARTLPYETDKVILFASDISDRILMEKAIKESEEKYRRISNLTSDYLFHTEILENGTSVLSWVAGSFEAITGYTVDEYRSIGGWRATIHPDDLGIDDIAIKKLIKNEKAVSELRTLHKDGHVVWVRSYGSPIWNEKQNRLQFIIGAVQDISQQKMNQLIMQIQYNIAKAVITTRSTDEFLTHVRIELSQVINTRNFIIAFYNEKTGNFSTDLEKDEKDSIESWPAEKSLSGYVMRKGRTLKLSRQNILDLNVSGAINLIGSIPEVWLGTPLVINKKNYGVLVVQSYTNPHEFDNNSQEILELIANQLSLFINNKRVKKAILTEREQLAVTLRSIGDGVITTDISGNIILINRMAEELTGWTQTEAFEKPVEKVFSILNEQTRLMLENPVERIIKSGGTLELEPGTILISKDGTERMIADSGAPIRDKNSNIIGVVLVFRDITEKQKLLQATQNNQKLESLGVLAGGIAHDFNNLLAGIYGYIDLAIMTGTEPRVSELLNKTKATMDRARALTRQLLTFSKGGSPIREIGTLFPFVKETAEFALSGSNVSIQFDIDPKLWFSNFDKNQIGQVIDNIIINAQQAMPAGGNITVSAKNLILDSKITPLLNPGKYITLFIKDSGIGIPKELVKRIFDPFFTTKSKGHGLGLATSYSIIKRHNGDIIVNSEMGKGTEFIIYLPAAEFDGKPEQIAPIHHHKGSGTILVMDDEGVLRNVIQEMLQALGYDIILVKDGQEVLSYLANEERHLKALIFDLTIIEGMGGKETIEIIRKQGLDLPVFVSSGYASDPIMAQPREYGFTASLRKPFQIAELSILLDKYLNTKQSH